MVKKYLISIIIIWTITFCIHASQGQMVKEDDSGNASEEIVKKKSDIKEEIKETIHEVTVEGKKIKYRATAGTMLLKEDIDDPKATIFFIAYTKIGAEDVGRRPITFSFNGGPGSSSVWLHLGLLGPKRVLMDDDGHALPPPYRLIENEYSLLDKTDLVFIDPVSTGFSRALPEEDPKQFHGIEEDVQSVGEFIRLYTTRFKRWASPKFMIGESYGTTRAAGLSGHLQERHGLYLNGIMLVSSILNFQTARFDRGNDLPHILFLPTFTATAWYHKKLQGDLQDDLQKALAESKAYALGEYASVLMKGDNLTSAEYETTVQKLSRLTGLSSEYIEQTNLRINIYRFVKELLREQRQTIGRLDSRFTGIDYDAAGELYEFDPSYAAIQGPYTATLNDYIRRDLEFESDLPYEILTGNVGPWNYGQYRNRYVNVAETLREAMTKNPNLKVFVANGFYDLATPFLATEYTFSHMGLDESLRNNVIMGFYEAGHMMYIEKNSLIQLKADLSTFIEQAISP